VTTALPKHRYDQETLIAGFLAAIGPHERAAKAERLYRRVEVSARHLALPMERYPTLSGMAETNAAYLEVAVDLGSEARSGALAKAKLTPKDLNAIFFTTVTGVATPSIDARIVNRLGIRTDVKRVPMFGLGCVAGAAGISRAADYLRAYPNEVAALVSVELCSLTLKLRDLSIANLVGSALFGDGASAVVLVGAERARKLGLNAGTGCPAIVHNRSSFYPDTEDVMGWHVANDGFELVLSAGVPAIATAKVVPEVGQLLDDAGLTPDDIATWVCHPGGPKVIQAFEQGFELGPEALALTRRSLAEVGNLSSSSVLFVLCDTIRERKPAAGAHGLMLAMGPGFCSELLLLSW
jgi:alkylresorcinol/alkylpyrone synthase